MIYGWGGIKTDNVITIFDWNNRLFVDEGVNVGYYGDVILMDVLFSLMTID